MTNALTIKPDSQVRFFLPIYEAYIQKLTQAFSQSKKKDYADAEWQLILNDGHIGKVLNQHVLLDAWEQMVLFLKKENKLYAFIEEKQRGLVEVDYKFWLFFSPNIAVDFFKNQMDRPKNFSPQAIISLPFIKLLEPFTEKLDRILQDKDLVVREQMSKTIEVLEIGEWFLDEADFTIFESHARKAVIDLTLSETRALLNDIHQPSASSILLEKRLNNLFQIGWRYFRKKNELETNYYKKLLVEDPKEREKGLKLAYKKVMDLKKEMQNAQ